MTLPEQTERADLVTAALALGSLEDWPYDYEVTRRAGRYCVTLSPPWRTVTVYGGSLATAILAARTEARTW